MSVTKQPSMSCRDRDLAQGSQVARICGAEYEKEREREREIQKSAEGFHQVSG